jgi:hypothetical protein
MRYASSAMTAVLLACAAGAAQAQDESVRATGQTSTQAETITVVGCLQEESAYRRQNDSGRGGVAGTGLGRGNEYVLINASRAGTGAPSSSLDCASTGTGEAYELTGTREKDLESFIGRAVQITGTLKRADVEPSPVGTSGSVRPEGGVDPLGQDLKLFELNVSSFGDVAAAQAQSSASSTEIASDDRSTQAVGTSGAADAAAEPLPATASPLALTGLIGLLSLGGALALRRIR